MLLLDSDLEMEIFELLTQIYPFRGKHVTVFSPRPAGLLRGVSGMVSGQNARGGPRCSHTCTEEPRGCRWSCGKRSLAEPGPFPQRPEPRSGGCNRLAGDQGCLCVKVGGLTFDTEVEDKA